MVGTAHPTNIDTFRMLHFNKKSSRLPMRKAKNNPCWQIGACLNQNAKIKILNFYF